MLLEGLVVALPCEGTCAEGSHEERAETICFLRPSVERPVQQDSQGARQEVSLPTTPAVTARLAALEHLFAIGDHILLPFLDHGHIPQGLAEPQHSSMAITAVHRVSQLRHRTPHTDTLSSDT